MVCFFSCVTKVAVQGKSIGELCTINSIHMVLFGYLAAVFIGISLGLIGGGGSILTVPVLVYLFHVDPVLATAYSLFIVGVTSILGSFSYYKQGLVDNKTAIVFGIPSLLAVFATRKWIVPAIPEVIYQSSTITFTRVQLLMGLFAILMIVASISMIRSKKENRKTQKVQQQKFNYPMILIEGSVVGVLTGLVGAGGGFLIIPALVMLSKLPMKKAVGTSLVIIGIKSLIGFLGETEMASFDWQLILSITAIAIIGFFVGSKLAHRIKTEFLKPAFGWFVLAMGIYVLLKG